MSMREGTEIPLRLKLTNDVMWPTTTKAEQHQQNRLEVED